MSRNSPQSRGIQWNRRVFIEAGLAAAVAASPACSHSSGSGEWRFFTPEQAETVEAICSQLIPTDVSPGAKEAGVVHYIDLQLKLRFKKYRAVYTKGIEETDTTSGSKFGKRFVALASDQQVELLTELEEKLKSFFDLILTHTRQGFYGDPRHGGNRGRVSWKMVGLPTPPVRGREHYPA